MRIASMMAVLAILLAAGCDEESGFSVEAQKPQVDALFGLARPDAPTTKTLTISKPFVPAATVDVVQTSGPFEPAPGQLPGEAPEGVLYDIDVVFTPPGITQQELYTGTITLRFTRIDGGLVMDLDLNLTASVENPQAALESNAITFGKVAVGEKPSGILKINNPNAATPITIESIVLLADPEFALDLSTTSFPFDILPGEDRRIPIIYTPASFTAHSGSITVTHDVGGALVATLAGEGMPGELIYSEFDSPFQMDGGGFAFLTFSLPPEAMSFSIYALDPNASVLDIAYMEGPAGKVYTQKLNPGEFIGPWLWYWSLPDGVGNGYQGVGSALSCQLPNSDAPDAQLIKGGGDYEIVFEGTPNGELYIRMIVEMRQAGATANASMPLNIMLAPSLPIDETTAPTDGKMQAVLARVQECLIAAGMSVGPVSYFKMDDMGSFEFDNITDQLEVDEMLLIGPFTTTPTFQTGDEERLNVFMVNSIDGSNITGLANSVPCPKPGPVALTSNHSGIVISYTTPPPGEIGKTMARMIGHACGLWPTVFPDGVTFDIIKDTPECPLFGTSEDCPIEGADNLMHPWDLGPQATRLTGGQRFVAVRAGFAAPD